MQTVALFLVACGFGTAPEPGEVAPPTEVAAPTPEPSQDAPKPTQEPRAISPLEAQIRAAMQEGLSPTIGDVKVDAPGATHKVHTGHYGSDYNAYPANNAVVFEGTIEGPLGNHAWSLFWLTASRDLDDEDAPAGLEAVLVYPAADEEEGPEPYAVHAIPTRHPDAQDGATLLGVSGLRVQDVDDDGAYEVIVVARYQPSASDKAPYAETMTLEISDGTVSRATTP